MLLSRPSLQDPRDQSADSLKPNSCFLPRLKFQNQIQKISIEGLLFLGKFHWILLNPNNLRGKYHYCPIFEKKIEVEKDKRSYSSLHRFQGQISCLNSWPLW